MLKESLFFHQTHLELLMKNDKGNDNDGNDYDDYICFRVVIPCQTVSCGLCTHTHAITQQSCEVLLP